MARKKKADLARIVEMALQLFLEKGYDAVSIEEICAAVGISKPTFYAANLTKRDLLIMVYHEPMADRSALPDNLDEISVCEDEHDIVRIFYSLCDLANDTLLRYGRDMLSSLYSIMLDGDMMERIMSDKWKDALLRVLMAAEKKDLIPHGLEAQRAVDLVSAFIVGHTMNYALGRIERNRNKFHSSLHALLEDPGKELL